MKADSICQLVTDGFEFADIQGTVCRLQHHTVYQFGGDSVIVWTGLCIGGSTDPHVIARGSSTAQIYRNGILRPIVRLFADAIVDLFLLVQGNTRAHTATFELF